MFKAKRSSYLSLTNNETGQDGTETGTEILLFWKNFNWFNCQCKNISKETLGKNFLQYLYPRLVKTYFKQSDLVISLYPTTRRGKTGPRWALKYYFFGKISKNLNSQCKNISKKPWVKIFLNIYAPVSLRLVLSKAI